MSSPAYLKQPIKLIFLILVLIIFLEMKNEMKEKPYGRVAYFLLLFNRSNVARSLTMKNGLRSDANDVELEGVISRQIGEMGTHLHVQVTNGIVTVTGSAEDFEEKRRIDGVVKDLAGKNQVINKVRVISTEDSFDNNR